MKKALSDSNSPFFVDGRCGGLTVSALFPRASGLGSNPSPGHCVVFLGKTLTLTVPLSTKEYKWVLANCWGNLTSFGGMLQKPGISTGRNEPAGSKASFSFLNKKQFAWRILQFIRRHIGSFFMYPFSSKQSTLIMYTLWTHPVFSTK